MNKISCQILLLLTCMNCACGNSQELSLIDEFEGIRINDATNIFIGYVSSSRVINTENGEGQELISEVELIENLKGEQKDISELKSKVDRYIFKFTPSSYYLFVLYGSEYINCCEGSTVLPFYNPIYRDNDTDLIRKIREYFSE